MPISLSSLSIPPLKITDEFSIYTSLGCPFPRVLLVLADSGRGRRYGGELATLSLSLLCVSLSIILPFSFSHSSSSLISLCIWVSLSASISCLPPSFLTGHSEVFSLKFHLSFTLEWPLSISREALLSTYCSCFPLSFLIKVSEFLSLN